MRPNSKFIPSILALILLTACGESLVRSEYRSTSGVWNKDEPIEFTFSGVDTLQRHNMFINVRNDNSYPFSNLFLIADLTFPNGDRVIDTLEYAMAKPNGEWLGKGMGSIRENKLWYKEKIIFPSSGVYTLRLSQAMRKNGSVSGVENLPGITDVGYEIDKDTN